MIVLGIKKGVEIVTDIEYITDIETNLMREITEDSVSCRDGHH